MRLFSTIFVVCVVALSACSEHDEPLLPSTADDISLRAIVDEVKTTTRNAEDGAYTGQVPSANNNLETAVWFTLMPGSYPTTCPDSWSNEMKALSAETNIPAHSTINFQSGTATFPDSESESTKLKYPTSGAEVYCVGLYPQTGWSVSNTDNFITASHTLDGNKDLMFAPEIVGSWNSHFLTQRYRHILTWLKILVCTTTPEAADYWGKLKKITINDIPKTVHVNLQEQENNAFSLQDAVTYSNDKQPITILNNDEGIGMGITTQDVASVFCHPSKTYSLNIECANASTKDLDIELKALSGVDDKLLNYPAGLQYILTLYFHPYNVVEGVCTLNAWDAQNEDLYPQAPVSQ